MDLWYETAIRERRDAALAYAERTRHARLCEGMRSFGIRDAAADVVQALSDALADIASVLRANNPQW